MFGEGHARVFGDSGEFASLLQAWFPQLAAFEPALGSPEFRGKIAAVKVNEVTLVAAAVSPVSMLTRRNDDVTLVVPTTPQAQVQIARRPARPVSPDEAMILPSGQIVTAHNPGSSIIVNVAVARLLETAQRMIGPERADLARLAPGEAIFLPLLLPGLNVKALIRHLCRIVDLMMTDPASLARLGVDEWFVRAVVAVVFADPLASAANEAATAAQQARSDRAVDLICDAVRVDPARPMQLRDMEELTGLGARSLQIAFRRRFGCSPTEWQRRERLNLAQERLLRAEGPLSIKALGFDMGFASPSAFIAHYRRQFGETPRATILRAGGLG
jgi:AraC-like DNA-binding protein